MTAETDPGSVAPVASVAPMVRPAEAPPGILTRLRWEGGVLALIAGLAGFAAGRTIETNGAGAQTGLLAAIALIASVAAFAIARPLADPLRTSGMDELRRELDRARRHNRPFALVRMSFAAGDPRPAASDVADGVAEATLHLVGASLRITDRAWRDGNGVVIIQPESDRSSAESFAERVRMAAPERFGPVSQIAVFPEDGLTSGALLDSLLRDDGGETRPEALSPRRVVSAATSFGRDSEESDRQASSEVG